MALNPNEAPAGFVAVEDDCHDACDHCDVGFGTRLCMKQACVFYNRKDGRNVRYRKKPIANWPYDSEGTPVEVAQ